MILQDAEINVTYLVEEVYLPRALERRLDALGIINGTKIKVLNMSISNLLWPTSR